MSRIGKKPIIIPSGVDVTANGNLITFKSGKKNLCLDTKGNVNFSIKDNLLSFTNRSDEKEYLSLWGTYRAISNNMIEGITKGFSKSLEINGVGYRAVVKGKVLNLQLGFSHDINYEIPKEIEISIEKNIVTVKGIDKQLVGQVCAEIRSFRPPEPYKGKGVKYTNEHIIRKAGKTAKK